MVRRIIPPPRSMIRRYDHYGALAFTPMTVTPEANGTFLKSRVPGKLVQGPGQSVTPKFFDLYIPRKPIILQRGNTVPVWVELVPGQTVSSGLGMGMMVVVPSFPKGQ